MKERLEYFLKKIDKQPNGCWLWTATLNEDGYGKFWVGKSRGMVFAHRWGYEHWRGTIPEGLELDHECRNRACVNPFHCEPVTHAENVQRGDAGLHWAAKTHCPEGHPYSDGNLAIWGGKRYCKTCRNGSTRKRREVQRRAAGRPLAPSKRTHCPQGHPYDEINTYVYHSQKTGRTGRMCRICLQMKPATPLSV
jgi:hypothetical protein